MKFFSLLLIAFLFSPDEDLSITGRVTTEAGDPVQIAQVQLEHFTDRRTWQTTVSPSGEFRFDRLPSGSYRISVRSDGFFDASAELRLEASKSVEFTLVPVQARVEEVEVIARPDPISEDAISLQHHVSENVIQDLPYKGRRDFLNALTMMPSVTRDNSGQMHIQGSRADQIQYSLDGMDLTDSVTGGLPSSIPIDAIESVDMELSGYSAEFGKGSGGVVRIQSQFLTDKFRWDVTDFLPGINFQERKISELSPRTVISGPLIREKLWLMYSGSLKYVKTFKDDIPDGFNRQSQTFADQFLKAQWNLGESHVATFSVLSNSEYFGNMGLSIQRPLETTTNLLRRGTTAAVSHRATFRNALLETIVQWSHKRDTDVPKGTEPYEILPSASRGNYFIDSRSRSVRYHISQTIALEKRWGSTVHRFKTGGQFDHVRADRHLERRPFQFLSNDGVPVTRVEFIGPNSSTIQNREYGAFIQDHIVLTPWLRVQTGVRADYERVAGRTNLSPRGGFSLLPFGNDTAKISGGVGLYFDSITLQDIQPANRQVRKSTNLLDGDIVQGLTPQSVRLDPALRNPSSLNWDIAWEQQWAPRWVSRISYTQKHGRKQVRTGVDTNPDGFDLVIGNRGASRYEAVEFTLDHPVRTDFRILASYTYSRARSIPSVSTEFPDPAMEFVGLAPEPWNVPHRFVSWGYFPLPFDTNASYSFEARSGFPFSTVDSLSRIVGRYNAWKLPATVLTSVSIERQVPIPFGKRVAVRIGVNNVFDRFNPRVVDANVESPGFLTYSDSSGRSFVARLRLIKN